MENTKEADSLKSIMIPDTAHQKIKVFCARNNITIRELVLKSTAHYMKNFKEIEAKNE